MSEIKTSSGIEQIHGKTNGLDSGYFYMRNGKQFYRTREENYQKNQSPRQQWNSACLQVCQLPTQTLDLSRGQSPTEIRFRGRKTRRLQRQDIRHLACLEI